jgi:cytoskeleton protein RodZ
MTKNRPQDRDHPAADSVASTLPQGSLGAWLRTQREARGVSLRDLAESRKISLRYLEALEQDRLDILPAPVFTRGFLREYARVVGLDADEVVNLYLLAAEAEPELPPVEPRAARSAGGPSPLGYGLLLVLAVVLLLAIAALVSWLAERRAKAATPVAQAVPVESTMSGPAAAPEDATDAGARSEPPAGGAAPTGAPAATPAGADAERPLRVELEFTEDCWVELVVDGQRRTSELRTSGEVVTLEARDSVLLTLGNAPGVRVEVDGRPFPLPTGTSRLVRDLRIDREAAARLAAPPAPSP